VRVSCQKCGRERYVAPSKFKRGHGKFCSKRCAGKAPISRLEVINDIRRVARELGCRPTYKDYKRLGNFSGSMIVKYGGFRSIFESIGMKFKSSFGRDKLEQGKLTSEFKELQKKLGRLPTSHDVEHIAGHQWATCLNVFGVDHWHEILIKIFATTPQEIARITPPKQRTYEMWLILLKGLAEELRRPPTIAEAARRIEYKPSRLPLLKGRSFKSVLHDAEIDSSNCKASPLVSNEIIMADIIDVAKRLNKAPSMSDYQAKGKYSVPLIVRRFGNWQQLKQQISNLLQQSKLSKELIHLSYFSDRSRDRIKESSVKAIRDYFKSNA
jgi:hypothetical protein